MPADPAAKSDRFTWMVELPALLIACVIIGGSFWFAHRTEIRDDAIANAKQAAANAAIAVERAAARNHGSYAQLDNETDLALRPYGYSAPTDVSLVIHATAGTWCIEVTDPQISGSRWTHATVSNHLHVVLPGDRCQR